MSNEFERRGYSVKEVALMYGVDHKTVRRMVATGELASFPMGARVLIPVSALEALERREQPEDAA